MSKIKSFTLRFSFLILVLIWLISLIIFAWFIKSSIANDFWVNVAAGIFLPLFTTVIVLSIVAIKNLPDRLKMVDLLQISETNNVLVIASHIHLPHGSGFTFNGRLRFGGPVIALEEYFAAKELMIFLEQDVLVSYPASLRKIIAKVPTMKPLNSRLQISPSDEPSFKEIYRSEQCTSIISLGSPGSNWVTAYVSKYHPGWFKFGTDGDYIKVSRGAKDSKYTLKDYKDIGIIQRVNLPNENITIITLAGLTEFSTKMCATYFLENWKIIASAFKDGIDFGICLAIPFDDDEPKIVNAYPERRLW